MIFILPFTICPVCFDFHLGLFLCLFQTTSFACTNKSQGQIRTRARSETIIHTRPDKEMHVRSEKEVYIQGQRRKYVLGPINIQGQRRKYVGLKGHVGKVK